MAKTDTDGDFDAVFLALGWRGKYQLVQLSFLFLLSLPLAFNVMSIIFIGYRVDSRCRETNNVIVFRDYGFMEDLSEVNVTYGECNIILTSNYSGDTHLPCVEGYEYLQPQKLSLASEWDLICGKESFNDLLQTLYMFGMGLGSVVFTIIGDKFGRKFAHVLGGILLLVVAGSMAFIPHYTPFAVMKILQGACQMGCGLTGVALSLEIVPTEQRSKIGIIGAIVWAFSVMIYAAAAYFMRDLSWRYHQLVVALTAAYFLLMPWVLDESCRWLASLRRYPAVVRILRKAARINGKNEEEIASIIKQTMVSSDSPETTSPLIDKSLSINSSTGDNDGPVAEQDTKLYSTEKMPILQIFKDRQIFLVSAVTWFMWLTNSMTYYGLSLTSTEFHSDKYLGYGLSSTMEVASAIAYWLTVDRFGRKKTLLGFHLLAGTSLILSVVFGNFTETIPSFSVAVTTLSLIGKFAITTSFGILWLYTPEMFPTIIRNVGFGLASMSARVGGILAPFSRTLHQYYPWAPGTIFGSCCILVTLLIRILPETAHRELAQTIQDMKNMLATKDLKPDRKKEKESEKKF